MPNKSVLERFESWVEGILYSSGDDPELLSLKKRFWISIFPSPFAMTFFGSFFWWLGSPSLGIAMYIFGAVQLLLIILFTLHPKRIELFALFNGYFFLVFSFIAVLFFGGILESAGVVFVGLAGALASLSFLKPKQYKLLFYLYFLSIIIEWILQPYLEPVPDLSQSINLLSFMLHMLVVAVNIYKILSSYIEQIIEIKAAETENLRELDNIKSNFYTNISHEFRTPITIILGMVDEIKTKPKIYLNSGLQLIKRNGNRLLHLVNELLDLSRLEAGQMTLNLVQADIVSHLRFIVESFEHIADKNNIDWSFECGQSEILMDFDPEKIQSIVSNLLSNALKYSDSGSKVSLKMEIVKEIPAFDTEIHCLSNRRNIINSKNIVSIKIEDTGHGMPKDQIKYISDRFYRIDNYQNTNSKSSGIGLALVKELIDVMSGKVLVKSILAQGTTFYIYLPINNKCVLSESPFQTEDQSDLFDSDDFKQNILSDNSLPKLLLVEDNMDVAKYIQVVLNPYYKIELSRNGMEGIKKAIEIIPDIIVSDIMMPQKDGLELCKTIKADFRTSHIPVVLLTAKVDMASKIKGLKMGADAYLAKPFNKEELLATLSKLIEARKRLQNRYLSSSLQIPINKNKLKKEDIFIQKIRELVEKKLSDDNFSVKHLCLELSMSRAQIYRKFEALTSLPVGKYIRTIRLKKAKEFLENDNLNVSEVAYETGFSSLSHFSSAFKKEFGISPSEIRKLDNFDNL